MKHPHTRALITGVGGQDGAWLAAHLLRAGIEVIGTHRPTSNSRSWRFAELGINDHPLLRLCALDIEDRAACRSLLRDVAPQAIYHLAGQSRVADSFRDPIGSVNANGLGTLNLLEAMRAEVPDAHFILASSAEIFGLAKSAPQNEETATLAASPYGLSKLLAHAAISSWRTSFGLAASSAILFNHESELRDPAFVTRKITRSAARIALGREQELALGNLDARRDFGYAPEYMDALVAMAMRNQGDDYVLATGHAASIRDFASATFAAAGMPLDWQGTGIDEIAVERGNGMIRIRVDPQFFRAVDAPLLVGDSHKARAAFGFAPSVDLAELTRRMLEADLRREHEGRVS